MRDLRDLRDDLRIRLQSIALEKATLSERMGYLAKVEDHLKNLLEYEQMRVTAERENANQVSLFPDDQPNDSDRSDLSMFLRMALSDGRRHSLEDLKRAATGRGIEFGDKNPECCTSRLVDRGVWRLTQAS